MNTGMCLKIAHRGAAGHAPENTLMAFRQAIERGADMIEFDTHLCRSGEVVIIHDARLTKTTDGRGFVQRKTLAELKKLDAGRGERIPTLDEVLETVNKRVQLNIELKGRDTAKPVMAIVRHYIRHHGWPADSFILSSFSRRELAAAKKTEPACRIGLLVRTPFRMIPHAKKVQAYSLHLPTRLATSRRISEIHEAGMKVFIYTVNNPRTIKKIQQRGADGIFSDYPERL